MKNKLTVLLLSAVMAVSGATAIGSAYRNNGVKAEESLLDKYFTYSEGVTLETNKAAPSYYYDGTKFSTGLKDFNSKAYGDQEVGVGVTFTQNSTISFNTPIYIGDNDMSTPLIEYMVTPKTPQSRTTSVTASMIEFERVVVTLTDVNDPSIYVNIIGKYSQTNSQQTFVEVETPTQTRAGVNKSILTSEDTKTYGDGTGIYSGFCGDSENFTTFFYDYNEMAVYTHWSVYASEYKNARINIVRDLNDPSHLLNGDSVFSGFTSGYVNLSISVKGMQSESASMIIRSIDGQKLLTDDTDIIDDTAPSVTVDNTYVENTPVGEAGKKYPFIPFTAYDVISLDDLSVKVNVYEGSNPEADATPIVTGAYGDTFNGFTPTESGYYTIGYIATDKAGNVSKETRVTVKVSQVLEDFVIEIDDTDFEKTMSVGQTTYLPKATVKGGSGSNYITRKVVCVETGEVVSELETFTPTRAGWYQVVYEYKDHLDSAKKYVIDVNVSVSKAPVFTEVSVPEVVLAGKKFYVPKAIATDYSSFGGDGKQVETVAKIRYEGKRGSEVISTMFETVTDEYIIPTITEGKIYLKYTASAILDKSTDENDNSYHSESETYVMQVKDLATNKELYKFFYTSDDIELEQRKMSRVSTQTIFKGVKDGAYVQFVNKLPISSLSFQINSDDTYTSINKLSVVVRDSENATERVTFTLSKKDLYTSNVVVNGAQYQVNGGMVADYRSVAGEMTTVAGTITLSIKNNALYDSIGMISKISTYDNGLPFNGFNSGKVYLNVVFDDVDEDLIKDDQISGVRFTDFCGLPSFGPTVKDEFGPIVMYSRDLSTYYDMNSLIVLPSATAIDLIDPDATVTLTVTDPLGNVINYGEPTEEVSLKLSQCGQYVIKYSAVDASGKKSGKTFSVYSADNFDPIIEIDGQFESTAKYNQPYTIHKALVSDNYDVSEDVRIFIYVFYPDGYIETVSYGYGSADAVEYNFTKIGLYRIRYFAIDTHGNYCHKIFEVNVTA